MPEMLMVKLLSWDSSNLHLFCHMDHCWGQRIKHTGNMQKDPFVLKQGQLLLEVIPDHLPGPAGLSYKPKASLYFFCRRERLQGREAAIKCLFPLLNLTSNLMEKDFLNTAFTTGQILNYKETFGSPRNLQIAQNHS